MSAPASPVETVVESSRELPLPMLENISDLEVGTRRTGTEFTEDTLCFCTIDFPAGSFRSEVFRIRSCMDENPEVEVVVENLRATMALAMRDGELLIGETSFTSGSIRRLTARWEGHFEDTWERDARPGAGWVEARNPSALSLESGAPLQGGRSLAARVHGGSPGSHLVGAAREGIEDRAALVHLRVGPGELTIADGDSILLFLAVDGEASIFGLALLPRATGNELVAIAYDDAGNARPSAPIAIDDGATDVEILWRGSSAPDARDGLLRLRDLEAPGTVAEIAGLDDDGLSISGWTLGASGADAPGTRGTLLLDAFRICGPVDRDAISSTRPRYRAARDPG